MQQLSNEHSYSYKSKNSLEVESISFTTCHFAKKTFTCAVFLAYATVALSGGGKMQVYAGWHKQYCDTLRGANINSVYDFIARKKLKPRRSVVVGIVDSGADTTCLSLRPSLWCNAKEKLDGNDSDGNGYVDDIHGWNFLGTADGNFNMVSAGTEEYREFKRLYPKYKGVKGVEQVAPADQEEFAYYLDMRKKAKINSYLTFFEITKSKQAALESVDSIVRHMSGLHADTLTLGGLMRLKVDDPQWSTYENFMLADMLRTPHATKWTAYLDKVHADYQLMARRIYGIEHDKDKRLLMGDNMLDATDLHYGNNNVGVAGFEHGNFVASVVAGQPADSCYAGIFPKAKLMIVRVSPDGDEYDKDVSSGIRYAVDNGAKVINLSLGKYTSPQAAMVNDAIAYAAAHDVLIVAAAGNNGRDIDTVAYFPTAVDNAGQPFDNYIRIGASGRDGKRLQLSNFGTKNVDLYAPGEMIAGVYPGDETAFADGTSVAAPVVTAIAAMLRAYYPKLTAARVKQLLVTTARHENGIAIVDAMAAFENAGEKKLSAESR